MIAIVWTLLSILLPVGDEPKEPAAPPVGIVGKPAPRWQVKEWANLPEGKTKLEIDDYRGEVVFLLIFQSSCKGCIDGGFPLFVEYEKHLRQKGLNFVAIQSAIEFAGRDDFARARKTGERFQLRCPVGHMDGRLFRRYRAFITPWIVIIDRKGVVRFNGLFLMPDTAKKMIDEYIAEPPPPDVKRKPKEARL